MGLGQGHLLVLAFLLYTLAITALWVGEYAMEHWSSFDAFWGMPVNPNGNSGFVGSPASAAAAAAAASLAVRTVAAKSASVASSVMTGGV